jgi:hypothetical protein
MENIAAISSAAPAARFNIYAFIHKAVRAFMSDTLARIGRMDAGDEKDTAANLQQLRDLMSFCVSHLEHENNFVHTAMEARQPGSTSRVAGEHVHHEESIKALRAEADALEHATGSARTTAAFRLYRKLAVFVGENLEHMEYEETTNNAVLWQHYSDAELRALEGAIVASLSPEESALSKRWMISGLNHQERVELLTGMRDHAPAFVFESALGMARTHLSDQDWIKLSKALALPQARAA